MQSLARLSHGSPPKRAVCLCIKIKCG